MNKRHFHKFSGLSGVQGWRCLCDILGIGQNQDQGQTQALHHKEVETTSQPSNACVEWSGLSGGKTLKSASQAQRMSKTPPTHHGTQATDHEAMAETSSSKCVVMKWLRYSGK